MTATRTKARVTMTVEMGLNSLVDSCGRPTPLRIVGKPKVDAIITGGEG